MLKLALTGALGAGKSEALRCFAREGAWTLSMDELHHELSRPGGPALRAVLRAFGRVALKPDGTLDRARLARRVFSDARALSRLERAVHPVLLRELRRRLARCRARTAVVDAAVLFEKGWQDDFDAVAVVVAPARVRLARALRRGMRRADAMRRMRRQWPQARKQAFADVILCNDGNLTQLQSAVQDCLRAFPRTAQTR